MRRGLPAALIAAFIAFGCTEGAGRPGILVITPVKERFEFGDTIKINLRNTGETIIGFQSCGTGSTLEHQVAGKWEPYPIGDGSRVPCNPAVPVVLGSQTRTNFVVRFSGAPDGVLPAEVPAGVYRIVLVSVMDTRGWVVLPRESLPFFYAGAGPG